MTRAASTSTEPATATSFPILAENIDREAKIATDEGGQYRNLKHDFPAHESVNHNADEWRRGDVHTNTVEGYFSIFKRGMNGRISTLFREASAPLSC